MVKYDTYISNQQPMLEISVEDDELIRQVPIPMDAYRIIQYQRDQLDVCIKAMRQATAPHGHTLTAYTIEQARDMITEWATNFCERQEIIKAALKKVWKEEK